MLAGDYSWSSLPAVSTGKGHGKEPGWESQGNSLSLSFQEALPGPFIVCVPDLPNKLQHCLAQNNHSSS